MLNAHQPLPAPTPGRPRIVIVPFAPTPYQVHLAGRLTAELPEAEFAFLYADESPDQNWTIEMPGGVLAAHLATNCPPSGKGSLLDQRKFFHRGKTMIDWVKRSGAGAVVCYGHNDLGRLRLARWCGRNGVPFFLAADSNSLLDRPTGWKRLVKDSYMRAFLGRATGVMVFGRRGAEYFARYGVPATRAFFVPYEPDYSALESVSQADAADACRTFSLDPARRRIVFCGRLLGLKRVDLLIDAFARIAADRPSWDVAIIGDGPERSALQARVPESLKDRFRWLGFVSDARTIGAIYRACDVLALPSDYEAWGLVVNEAMFLGLSVATSNIVGAAAHLVREGEPGEGANGRTFQRGDAGAFARALSDLTDPLLADSFKANSGGILAAYRIEADPVLGMRRALIAAGVLRADR